MASKNKVYFVLEYVKGGELFTKIVSILLLYQKPSSKRRKSSVISLKASKLFRSQIYRPYKSSKLF